MNAQSQEIPSVKLKGVGDSLWVTLDPSQPIELLFSELRKIFDRLRHLAINARIVLDTGEPVGHDELIENITHFLKENFSVGIVSRPAKKRSKREEIKRQLDIGESWYHHKSDVLMIAGLVRSGQKIKAKKHLIVMGDVNPGAEIIAGGDIIVMGRLCGLASAGYPSDEESIIFALDFRPTQVQIGGFVAAGIQSSLTTKIAEFAHIEQGAVVVEDYLKANPFGRFPWPETR